MELIYSQVIQKDSKSMILNFSLIINVMRTNNPKCTNENYFKYSILISLHYYDLNTHKERINQLNKYISKYSFNSNNYDTFEKDNPNISLSVYDEYGNLLIKTKNNSNNKAHIIKINTYIYHALKTDKDKHIQLKQLLKQFTHKEITEFIMNKVTH